MNEENENKSNYSINVGVEKNKGKHIIIIVLCLIIVILLTIIGIIVLNKNKTNENNNQNNNQSNNLDNNQSNNQNNVPENVTSKNIFDNLSQDVISVYNSLEGADWMSKVAGKFPLFNIKDNKVFYKNDTTNLDINFNLGNPKYIYTSVRGGAFLYVYVITDEGTLYKSNYLNEFMTNNYDISKITFSKIDLNEKVIDITEGGNGVKPFSGPYFLTVSGKLLTEKGITYKEINREHIRYIEAAEGLVYLNKDKTIEIPRSLKSNEYLTVNYENSKVVKSKYVFMEMSERWTGTNTTHFYIIDENNKLLDCSDSSIYIASEYLEASGKTVSNVIFTKSENKINIVFTDGSTLQINKVYQYAETK